MPELLREPEGWGEEPLSTPVETGQVPFTPFLPSRHPRFQGGFSVLVKALPGFCKGSRHGSHSLSSAQVSQPASEKVGMGIWRYDFQSERLFKSDKSRHYGFADGLSDIWIYFSELGFSLL